MFQDLRNRNIDLIDAVLVAESQSRKLEHFESEPVNPVSQSDLAIPTGLGDDIKSNIEQHRKARDSRRC